MSKWITALGGVLSDNEDVQAAAIVNFLLGAAAMSFVLGSAEETTEVGGFMLPKFFSFD